MSAKVIAKPVSRIGVIDFGNPSFPNVRYTELETSSPKPLDLVEEYHYLPDSITQVERDDPYWFTITKATNSRKTFSKIVQFLGSGKANHRAQISMQMGRSAIVRRVGAAENVSNIYFFETSISPDGSSNSHCVPSRRPPEFVQVRAHNLRANDTMEEIDSVHILTGTCMLSMEHLPPADIDENATPSLEDELPLYHDERATLYEIESITYLSESVADTVSTLPPNIPITITLDVPRIQYYASALDLYRLDRCTLSSLSAWMAKIDRRHDQIVEVFIKSIQDALRRRGLELQNVQIKASSDFDAAMPALKAAILEGIKPTAEHLSKILSGVNPLWNDFRELADNASQNASTLHTLCNLSYSFEFLRPILERARRSRAGESFKGRQLIINVDSCFNQKIFIHGERMLKVYRRRQSAGTDATILGLWPLQRVFIGGTTGKSDIHKYNPGQNILDLEEMRVMTPGDVLSQVYGIQAIQPVLKFMEEAGISCGQTSDSVSSSAQSFVEKRASTSSAGSRGDESAISSDVTSPGPETMLDATSCDLTSDSGEPLKL